MNNSEAKKQKKMIAVVLIILSLGMVGVGSYLSYSENNKKAKSNSNTVEEKKGTETSETGGNKFFITKEERYVNNTLMESVTYKYNSKEIVESADFKYDCKDYEHCGFLNLYAVGLYKYKYKVNDKGILENLIATDFYSANGYSLYLDNDLKIKSKYSYSSLGYEDKTIEVKYEYDKTGQLIKRTGYKNPDCLAFPDAYGACKKNEKATVNSTVTFKYENGKLIEEAFSLKNGTTYINKYVYDNHKNVTEFLVEYKIKKEDDIIVNSDSFAGEKDYNGKLNIKYEYKYNNDLIQSIKVNANLNNSYTETYNIKREYDKNNNLILEVIDGKKNIYKRKIYYKAVDSKIENYQYLEKMNKMQTATDSFAEYLYKDDNWLSIYSYYIK